jgi:hypothetical protein
MIRRLGLARLSQRMHNQAGMNEAGMRWLGGCWARSSWGFVFPDGLCDWPDRDFHGVSFWARRPISEPNPMVRRGPAEIPARHHTICRRCRRMPSHYHHWLRVPGPGGRLERVPPSWPVSPPAHGPRRAVVPMLPWTRQVVGNILFLQSCDFRGMGVSSRAGSSCATLHFELQM